MFQDLNLYHLNIDHLKSKFRQLEKNPIFHSGVMALCSPHSVECLASVHYPNRTIRVTSGHCKIPRCSRVVMYHCITIWVQTAPVFIPNHCGFSATHVVTFTTFTQILTTCRLERPSLRRPRLLLLWKLLSTFGGQNHWCKPAGRNSLLWPSYVGGKDSVRWQLVAPRGIGKQVSLAKVQKFIGVELLVQLVPQLETRRLPQGSCEGLFFHQVRF